MRFRKIARGRCRPGRPHPGRPRRTPRTAPRKRSPKSNSRLRRRRTACAGQQRGNLAQGRRRHAARARSIPRTQVWQQVFRVNFFAPIMLARGLVEELKAAKGSVVNVTSIAGSHVHPFAGAAYATSKAALASLTREMAVGFRSGSASASTPSRRARSTPRSCRPAPRKSSSRSRCSGSARTDEVAKIIYVLCTEMSSYVNGAEIHINGGQHV